MKKAVNTLASCVLAGILLASSCWGAELYLDETNRNITNIEAETTFAEGTKLTVSIFKKGFSYSNIPANGVDVSEVLPMVKVLYTDENGTIKTSLKCKNSGEYDIYVSDVRGVISGYPQSVFIGANMEDKYELIKTGGIERLKEIFAYENAAKEFLPNESEAFNITNGEKTGEALFAIREGLTDKTEIEKYIRLAFCLSSLSDEQSAKSMDRVVSERRALSKELSLSELYNGSTASIKENMALRLATGYKLGLNEFEREYKDALILAGVYKSNSYYDAKKYCAYVNGFGASGDEDKELKAVVGKDYNCITDLEYAIANADKAETEIKKPSGTGGGGGGGGGIAAMPKAPSNTEGKTETGESGEKTRVVFSDVAESHWGFEAVNYLNYKEIISGDEEGRFNPEKQITRAEVVKILCKAFEADTSSTKNDTFKDVQGDKWYYEYVNYAKDKGLVLGDENGNFYPEKSITRADLAVLIYRFSNQNNVVFEGEKRDFADYSKIDDYAKEAVSKMASGGIINGFEDNTFRPFGYATRCECAAIVHRMLRK